MPDFESQLILRHAHRDLAGISRHAAELRHAFRRDDDVDFLAARKLHFQVHQCQAASVGRHHGQLSIAERKQDAVQHVARLVGGDGVGRFLQRIAQFLLLELEDLCAFELRQRRELLLGQSQDLEEALAAANAGDVLRVHLDRDIARRQFADDCGEAPRRQCRGAFALHLGLDAPRDAHVQIGRSKTHLTVTCLKKDVRQDRQSGSCADDVLDSLQTCEELLFADAKFHKESRGGLDD